MDCPKCGCNAVEQTGWVRRWGGRVPRWQCDHCGHEFRGQVKTVPAVQDPKDTGLIAVDYHILHCPHCGSTKTRVQTTRPPVRYHECHTCGKSFKSIETHD